MNNPFLYGKFITEKSFCNRQKELKEIRRSIDNKQNLFIYGERRLGKTSLVKLALRHLPATHYVSCYVDLWPTDDEVAFTLALAKAISISLSAAPEKILSAASKFFGRLSPHISLDEYGKPVLSFGIDKHSLGTPELEQVLSVPARLASQERK